MSILVHAAHGIGNGKWVGKVITTNDTAQHLFRYHVDTQVAARQITIPAGAPNGVKFRVGDYAGTFSTNNCTIVCNGEKIMGVVDDYVLDVNNIEREFEKIDSTRGWIIRRVG